MILKITEAARDLGDYPLAGHVVEECGSDIFREYAVWPFRLIYRVKPDAIIILAIVHGAQQMPTQIFKRR